MDVRIPMLGGIAVALSATAPALADGPWYVSGSVGGYFREADSTSTLFFHSDDPGFKVPGSVRRSFDPSVIGNVAVGYMVMPQIRVEAELGYTDYNGSTLNPVAHDPLFPHLDGRTFTHQSGNDWERFMGTVNIFYDFLPIAGITPYVGGGLGASANDKSLGIFLDSHGNRFTASGSSGTEGLGLVEAGASYPLADNLAITASYRYMHFFDAGEDIAHIVKMGVRYTF